jgi:aspartyl-tRNA(Asn)/glutamyl-tRNA(Gln) amidotransferase subunit C
MEFEIEKIAELARLSLKPEEKKKLAADIPAILAYMKKLDSLDTKNIKPTSHVLDLENVFRPDEAKPSQVRDEALDHAPSREGKFFKVPKVVEKE